MTSILPRLVASPCCLPRLELPELLGAYRELGFSRLEGFSEWATSRLDWRQSPAIAREQLGHFGFSVTSFHLPLIKSADIERGLDDAIAAARYARELGASVVLLKAANKEIYRQIGARFLDALEAQHLELTTVVQNHKGTAITTLEDYREVFDSLGGDPRLKAVLEVGHFARVGTGWREAWQTLGERVALIHVNDVKDGQSVFYGTGDVDFSGLLGAIQNKGYNGNIVVELELETRETQAQLTLDGLNEAVAHLEKIYRS